mmetsp:Transcript_89883/g.254719  ORF Transcript_89883/g.254719 Transcript_89883/m.254719 type:complete len:284 (+) Transcript_89883:85-936(+)
MRLTSACTPCRAQGRGRRQIHGAAGGRGGLACVPGSGLAGPPLRRTHAPGSREEAPLRVGELRQRAVPVRPVELAEPAALRARQLQGASVPQLRAELRPARVALPGVGDACEKLCGILLGASIAGHIFRLSLVSGWSCDLPTPLASCLRKPVAQAAHLRLECCELVLGGFRAAVDILQVAAKASVLPQHAANITLELLPQLLQALADMRIAICKLITDAGSEGSPLRIDGGLQGRQGINSLATGTWCLLSGIGLGILMLRRMRPQQRRNGAAALDVDWSVAST